MAEYCKTADYADSVANPVVGCDGCELWTSTAERITAAVNVMEARGCDSVAALEVVRRVLESQTPSLIHQGSEVFAKQIVCELGGDQEPETVKDVALALQSGSDCAAGQMFVNWGPNPFVPNYVCETGWHSRFESPTLHKGALWKAANWGEINGSHPGKPWLNGYPRIVLISLTGEALSESVPFKFLRRAIIDHVSSKNGRRHIYLWNTRRCGRMAEFAEWLVEQGGFWPPNLIPLGSVSRMSDVAQLVHLCRIPATVRGILAQPMLEPLELDLTSFGWLIVGGETGPNARPFELGWARAVRLQCLKQHCPFFVNSVGWNPCDGGFLATDQGTDRHLEAWPEELRVRQVPSAFKFPQQWPVSQRVARV